DLCDRKLYFERLLFRGEDGAEALRIDARQPAGSNVLAIVRIAADVSVTDSGLPEAFKLVVLPHGGERDLVIDLTDLVERRRRVFRHQRDAVSATDHDD